MIKNVNVQCPYCGKKANLVGGVDIYPKRPDLWKLNFWACKPCDAYVGVHKNSQHYPMGRLANKALRTARVEAHKEFDLLWKKCGMTRSEAYSWLAGKLGTSKKKCHIGSFGVNRCVETKNLSIKKRHRMSCKA